MKMNLDTLEKVFELMKKYGVLKLQDADEFNITMRDEQRHAPIVYPQPNGSRIPQSSDEDILMNPYHNLEGMGYQQPSFSAQKGEVK